MRVGTSIALCCLGLLACDHVTSVPNATAGDAAVHNGWTVIPAGTANLNAVSGVSEEAVWAVGDHGTIWRWNGTTIVPEKSGTTATLRGVFALDAEDAYAVGDAGTILQRTAGGWQQVGEGVTRQVLTAVWADTTRVVAVGSGGTIILGAMNSYQVIPLGTAAMPVTENIFGVTGTPGGVVTAVGALGLVVELNGASPTRTPIPSFSMLLNAAATGPSASYYVGQQGIVYRADATGINLVPGCPGTALRAVAVADTNAWVVGWDGTICELSPTSVSSFPYRDARRFNGIYAASPTSLWVVGASGTVLHGLPDNPNDAGAPESVP